MKKGSSKLLLLDVNVLLALTWPNHQFHASALNRLETQRDQWATCAITQLGFIRLSSNPAAVGTTKTPGEAAKLLAEMLKDPLHVYLSTMPSPISRGFHEEFHSLLGGKQITDAYLLCLARSRRATLVRFDARLKSLAGNPVDVEVLS